MDRQVQNEHLYLGGGEEETWCFVGRKGVRLFVEGARSLTLSP